MNTIAILGLGAMGRRMAHHLLNAGYRVVVYNRDTDKATRLVNAGAIAAATPRQAAAEADLAISMVTDIDASRAIWLGDRDGALLGLRTNAVAMECSTVTPAWIAELGQQAKQRGVDFLDAPVAGSRPQAEAGQLIFLVGGEQNTLSRVEPVLKTLGGAVHHIGPNGQGMVMKLAVNALFGIQVAAAAELLAMTQAAGLAPARTAEVLAALPITSPAVKASLAQMTARNFAPLFPIHLVAKDFGYIETMGAAAGATTPVTGATRQVFDNAVRQGLGGDNINGVLQLFER